MNMAGLFERTKPYKYECEDGDIKTVNMTVSRKNALSINAEPATNKNDNDSARRGKPKRAKGLRPRYVIFRYEKDVTIETANGNITTTLPADVTIPILKKDTVAQITIGGDSPTTITLQGLTFKAYKFVPESAV